jgi:phosphate/sulfate permease
MFSDSFAGIAPDSAPAFVMAQLAGAALAVPVASWLGKPASATEERR